MTKKNSALLCASLCATLRSKKYNSDANGFDITPFSAADYQLKTAEAQRARRKEVKRDNNQERNGSSIDYQN